VAEHALNRSKIRSAIEQMRREGVAQRVRMQIRSTRTQCAVTSYQVLHLAHANPLAEAGNEESAIIERSCLVMPKFVSTHQPLRECILRERTERHDALLATLADHARSPAFGIELHIADVQPYEFRDA
jgi:hypothetical protein